MSNIIKMEAPELAVIEASKALQIKATFEPMVKMLEQFEGGFNDIVVKAEKEITLEVVGEAKRLRIDIGKVRIATEKLRVEQKEEYLRAGKAIDGVANILKWAVSDKEDKLKEIENYFELQEKERKNKLQLERVELLKLYVEDASDRDLAGMEEDVWVAYLAAKKKDYEDQIEAARLAEEERKAKEKEAEEERERLRIENEKLRLEAEKRAEEERERLKKEAEELEARRKKEDEERKEREVKEAEQKAITDKLEKELREKREAEEKAKADEEAAAQAELAKGDVDKVKDLIEELGGLKTKFAFKSAKNKKMYVEVGMLLDKIINHIQS